MDILNNLEKITDKSARRVGRGIGSTNGGHTTGRGNKGDTIRGKTKLTFDGTKIKKSWIKRLPFLRGKHRLLNLKNITVIQLEQIEKLYKSGETVDLNSLAKKVQLNRTELGSQIKVLSKGELTKAVNFKGVLVSEAAKQKIISAGGNID